MTFINSQEDDVRIIVRYQNTELIILQSQRINNSKHQQNESTNNKKMSMKRNIN